MGEISIAGRTVTVSLVATTHGEDGDIQRYLVEVSGSDAATHLSILRVTSAVDARAMASAIETELLLDYPGSRDDGVLRDPSVRAWRDEHRTAIEAALGQLRDEITGMPPEPVSDVERTLLRAFEMDPDAPDPRDA